MVITGQGISNIIGIEELAMLTLKLNQVRICTPKLINIIKPQHATVYGMVKYIASLGASKHVNSDIEIITNPKLKDKILEGIDDIKQRFSDIFDNMKKIEKKSKKSKKEEYIDENSEIWGDMNNGKF
jgi:hypothetical protein